MPSGQQAVQAELQHVSCAGIYHHSYDKSLNIKNGFPVFSTIIEAHHVGKSHDDFAAFKLTDEDKEAMHKLSKLPDIGAAQSSDLVVVPLTRRVPCFCTALLHVQDPAERSRGALPSSTTAHEQQSLNWCATLQESLM